MTNEQVLAIYAELKKTRTGVDLFRAARTEVHAALQLEKPFPYSDNPPHIPQSKQLVRGVGITHEERVEARAHMKAQVTDAEVLASERARSVDPTHIDAHHHVQKQHGIALWAETDRLLAAAGIKEGA